MVDMFKIDYKKTVGYVLHKTTKDHISVCKILKECSSMEEAEEDLVRLLSGNVTEKELLKENEKNKNKSVREES